MSLPQFNFTQVADNTKTTTSSVVRVINALFSNLQSIFNALLQQVQLNSVVLQNIQLNQGLNQIPHTLGRKLTGWHIIGMSGVFAQVYDLQSTNPNTSTYLYLESNTSVSVSLLVF